MKDAGSLLVLRFQTSRSVFSLLPRTRHLFNEEMDWKVVDGWSPSRVWSPGHLPAKESVPWCFSMISDWSSEISMVGKRLSVSESRFFFDLIRRDRLLFQEFPPPSFLKAPPASLHPFFSSSCPTLGPFPMFSGWVFPRAFPRSRGFFHNVLRNLRAYKPFSLGGMP